MTNEVKMNPTEIPATGDIEMPSETTEKKRRKRRPPEEIAAEKAAKEARRAEREAKKKAAEKNKNSSIKRGLKNTYKRKMRKRKAYIQLQCFLIILVKSKQNLHFNS